MKELLIAEMKRAIELLEAKEKPLQYDYRNIGDAAELKRLMLSIRKHSISFEKANSPYWRSKNV